MTTKRFPVYRDIINLTLIYLVVMSVFMVISSGMRIRILPAEYIAIAGLLLCSYLLREHARRLVVTVILHALMIAACFFVPLDIPGSIRVVVAAVVLTLLDIHHWLGEEKSVPDVHPGLGAVIFAAFLLTGGRLEFGYSGVVYYMGVSFALLIMIRALIANFYQLSASGQLTDEMPVREIFRNNTFIAAGIMGLTAAGMLFIRSDRLIAMINKAAYTLWTRFAELISKSSGEQEPDAAMSSTLGNIEDLMRELSEMDEAKGPLVTLLQILDSFIIILAVVVVMYVLVKLVVFLVRILMGKRNTGKTGYRTYRVKNEVRQRLRDENADRKRSLIFKTPAEKVRHIYKKELLKFKKDG
ncbi:MAG: hypothetical protein J5842_07675, partial [Lachnospiraceae bacterium]|nr:hypothetical protein [Lachnospiraceae bacterium]